MNHAIRKLALAAMALAVVSCTENLPVGPNTFAAHLSILSSHDTVVVGDLNPLTAQTKDDLGRVISGLKYTWSTNSPAIGDLSVVQGDTTGQTTNILGRHTGTTIIGLALPDPRFVTTAVTRTQTVVVAGVRVLSTKDSTLTAVNDTGTAIAMGLIHSNGASVTSPGQTVQWTHLGSHVRAFSGNGAASLGADTIKYIAQSNGADTLIAGDQFCLVGAKCADTVIVRVSQQLSLTLSAKAFNAFSFNDSVGPTVRFADRRGNGLQGTSIQLVPFTATDSLIVGVSGPIGTTNPINGQMAVPRLIARANGTARVAVNGIAPDGFSVLASDVITVTVRQVARTVAVEPLRAHMTVNDSIPIKSVARDARGAAIADATIVLTPVNISLHDIWAGPTVIFSAIDAGTITPTLTGVALPQNNPLAPQITPDVLPSRITLVQRDTAVAGATTRTFSFSVLDSVGHPAAFQWIRFEMNNGIAPDSVQLDNTGSQTVQWTPPNTAGLVTLTGLRGTPGFGPFTLPDSAGRIVVRRSLLVIADVPSAATSTLEVSNTTVASPAGTLTVIIRVKDKFGNIVTTAKPTDFSLTNTGAGTLDPATCSAGVCSATYHAPAAPGADAIHVQIGGVEISFSPIAITIT